uniref:Dual specificity protein kinase TTK n=1 Tax=Myripristis murdjan TaxID=586833 RepID=A0A667Y3X4_9TELE
MIKQQIAMLYQKLNKIKKSLNEDDTDSINQVISSNAPETCWRYLMDLERKGDPHLDRNHLSRLMDFYTRVFSSMPLGKHGQNESYARMLVRFAELKAIQDVNEAEANFNVARSHSQDFAFVHIAHSQFEHSQGNTKRAIYILQRAIELDAKPKELLEAALQSLYSGKAQLVCAEDKENAPGQLLSLIAIVMSAMVLFCFRQTSASSTSSMFALSSSKKTTVDGDFLSLKVSKIKVNTTYNFNQVINSNSPESCETYLLNLEKRGNPHTDVGLFTKLKDCYSKVFSRLPLGKHSKNESYARILVRYAELKGIEDPDEAQDHFIVARSNCKGFAFVHIAHAQFEVSQGKVNKAASILHKAQGLNAKPAELLEVAMRNLKAGKKQLLPTEEEQRPPGTELFLLHSKEDSFLHLSSFPSLSFVTPVVKRDPIPASATAHRVGPAQQPCTPLQVSYSQTPQPRITAFSNDSITIKGKQFFILKMIGRGGSSKVYQVLDHKKQLFAVKFVNLEEADAQTVESYKNEIEHLNHLQQYSDQIIKLYDYEITNSYIYMLMECGNLDLNTWLRNRKTVNPLERKFYWKNMLEAVQTIHKHGIVHSDLKPANFVIVNASLKLIDFGIANRIQPDVTSIMKDSQVGTLNYMPPEAIKDTSSKSGKASSKISPKGDVWSLGCILYCMTYGKTPFQSITNQITKLHAIIDPSHEIEFPDISEKDLLDVLKRCLVRNPRERISIAELLEHPYLQLQPQPPPEPEHPSDSNLRKILTDLAALQSPNSIIRAANNLAKMCNSGRKLDVAECAKSSSSQL